MHNKISLIYPRLSPEALSFSGARLSHLKNASWLCELRCLKSRMGFPADPKDIKRIEVTLGLTMAEEGTSEIDPLTSFREEVLFILFIYFSLSFPEISQEKCFVLLGERARRCCSCKFEAARHFGFGSWACTHAV